jgi:hypothetical protein
MTFDNQIVLEWSIFWPDGHQTGARVKACESIDLDSAGVADRIRDGLKARLGDDFEVEVQVL